MRHLCSFPALALVLLLVAGCSAPGCTRRDAAPPNRDLASGSLRGSNLLLVTIDTLRADRVGAYGGGTLTPALDRLAAGGIRFTSAHAHVPLTLPAHTSILTGLVPATHGVHNNGASGLDAQRTTLADRLRGAGYRTGAFVGAFVLDARFGLSRGFDVYDDKVGSETGPITFAFAERPADRVTTIAGDWIVEGAGSAATRRAETRRPWFSWIHLFDPHAPYRAPQQRVANPYDNEVAFVDAEIGRLFDRLRAEGQLDRTLIVVLADHGESLGDHGEATHGLFAYDATLRIPLIVGGPSIHPDVSNEPVAQADVLPTILDLLGVAAPAPIDGHSVLASIRGEAAAHHPIYFEALEAYLTRNWAPLTGVIAGGWKYIDLPEPELYDLANDPGELHNLAGREPGRMAALGRRLADWSPPSAAPASARATPIDPDAAARLRALGYVAAQAPRSPRTQYGVADDPKRLLDLDRRYQRALSLTGDRRYEEAVALLRSVVGERPDFMLAYTNLASVLLQAGHPRDAIQILEDAGKHGVVAIEIQERLGAAHLGAGDPGRAVAVLEPLAGRDGATVDALNTLGVAYAQMGRRDEARRVFRHVLEKSPRAASTWNNLGLLELAARRPRDAASAFAQATGADPRFAPAWRGLGAATLGWDRDGAIAAWKRAVDLDPEDYDTVFNVGTVLADSGRLAEARPYLERFLRGAPPSRYAADIARVRALLGT